MRSKVEVICPSCRRVVFTVDAYKPSLLAKLNYRCPSCGHILTPLNVIVKSTSISIRKIGEAIKAILNVEYNDVSISVDGQDIVLYDYEVATLALISIMGCIPLSRIASVIEIPYDRAKRLIERLERYELVTRRERRVCVNPDRLDTILKIVRTSIQIENNNQF